MSLLLKQSTARNVPIFLTNAADHISGLTGATLTITSSQDGGGFSSISPTVTELSNGWYNLALTTTHTNTLGCLALHITATGADPTDVMTQVVLDLPGASVSSVTGNVSGSVASVTGNVGGNIAGSVGSLATQAKTDVSNSVWDISTSSQVTSGTFGMLMQQLLTLAQFLGLK